MKSILLVSSQILLLFVYICNGANILLLTPMGSKSHLNCYMGMFKPLAERGHQITVVSAYGSTKNVKNIRHVVLPSKYGASTLVRNVFTDGTNGPMLNLLMHSPQMCVDSLTSDLITELKKEKFDLVLMSAFMCDCYFSLVHHFKASFVYLSPAGVVEIMSEALGNPYFVSLSGNIMLEGTYPFRYFYRLRATLLEAVFMVIYTKYTVSRTENLCRESGACPPDMPSFHDIRKNASIVMVNSIKYLQPNLAPDMPHIIYAGGSHCVPAKPLPDDIEKWVQGAGEAGFIYFSLGSAVTPSDMPESARKVFIKVFAKLKQRVLWKWDKDMKDLPSNVLLGKWLPQQDILAHPKLRLFISHGGLLSIMETTYHGAKILGMPLFADQYTNIGEGVSDGWAESLHWADLSEETLENKIKAAFNKNDMTTIVAKRAKIMNDLPRPPKEEVIFWIEYVIRHNGAPHLRSPLHDMPLYVLYNADVWLTIILLLIISGLIIYFVMRATFRYCFSKTKTSKKKKKKQ